jgi:hypothetical protein
MKIIFNTYSLMNIMKFTRRELTKMGIITAMFFFALVTNIAWSQWSNPTAAPTGGNTPAPINEGGASQEKAGSLGIIGNLTVGLPGGGGSIVSHNWERQKNNNPTIIFEDTDGSNWYAHVNSNRFYLLQDDNSSGPAWDNLGWHPMEIARSESGGVAYNWVRFADQIRAGNFCDHYGGNCISAGTLQSMANRITTLESAAPATPSCAIQTTAAIPSTNNPSCPAGYRLTGIEMEPSPCPGAGSGSGTCTRGICSRIVCS